MKGKVLKNKKEYEPYITDDILNLVTKYTLIEYNDGKWTIVTKTKTHFINKDKEEMDKVETKIRSVKNIVDYHIPNEDKIPYHEK